MPTPSSSHTPDLRPHPFASTCPDDQQDTQPPSPSSWHPLPPPPYINNASQVIVGLPVSSSLLAPESPESLESPQSPESRPTSSSNVDEPSSSPSREETVETSMTAEEDNDALKAGDQLQEDMTRLDGAVDNQVAMAASGALRHQDGVLVPRSSGSSSRRRRPAGASGSLRGRRRMQDEHGEDGYMGTDWGYDSSVAGHVFSQLRVGARLFAEENPSSTCSQAPSPHSHLLLQAGLCGGKRTGSFVPTLLLTVRCTPRTDYPDNAILIPAPGQQVLRDAAVRASSI